MIYLNKILSKYIDRPYGRIYVGTCLQSGALILKVTKIEDGRIYYNYKTINNIHGRGTDSLAIPFFITHYADIIDNKTYNSII